VAGTWTNLEVVLGHQYEVSRSPRRLLKSRVKPVEPSSTSCASITGLATVLAAAPIAAFASLRGPLATRSHSQAGVLNTHQSLAVGLSVHMGPSGAGPPAEVPLLRVLHQRVCIEVDPARQLIHGCEPCPAPRSLRSELPCRSTRAE
jgi:hypothetical protein